MDARTDDAVVVGDEHLIEGLALPDPNDRRVLAAAIGGGADVIVTHNLMDFPDAALAPHKITAMRPDAFILRLLGASPEDVLKAIRAQQASLKNPPVPMPEMLALSRRIGLIKTVAALRRLLV